jgi:hypothetical protein
MAKINEQTLVITLSQLVKDDTPTNPLLSPDVVAQLEAVVGELAGAGTLVDDFKQRISLRPYSVRNRVWQL